MNSGKLLASNVEDNPEPSLEFKSSLKVQRLDIETNKRIENSGIGE